MGFTDFAMGETSGFSRTEVSLHLLEKQGNPSRAGIHKKKMNCAAPEAKQPAAHSG